MSFTKVTSAGIGSTELVTLDSLEVINNLTVGGVLTYEDVTNVDSIGIITARAGVLVGSGITLSKDGDIFATGVTTSTTFVGALTGTASLASNLTGTPNISCGTIAGSTGTFSGAVSGTTGTFSGAVSGTTGTFSGDVSITDKIVHTGDTDTAIRFAGNDIITAEIAGTETFRIDGTGLKIVDKLLHSGDTDTMIRFPAGDTITAETNGAERLRITSDGQLKQTAASGSTIITFKRSDANTTGAFGVLNFAASDDHSVANIQVLGDGDNEGAHIVFKTTSAAASDDPYNAATVERLRITSAGNIGIGDRTTSPDELLHVHTASGEAIIHVEAATNPRLRLRAHSGESIVQFADSASSNPGEINYTHSSDSMSFRTNGNVRSTIDSSGRLLVGTTSARAAFNYTTSAGIQAEGTYNHGSISATNNENNGNTCAFVSAKIRATGAVNANDTVGTHDFQAFDGTAFRSVARMDAIAISSGGISNNVISGDIRFVTRVDSQSPHETMRLSHARFAGSFWMSFNTKFHKFRCFN